MNSTNPTELPQNSNWSGMLGKMEETLSRLLAEEESAHSSKEPPSPAKAPHSAKESKLLHRLDQHLGKLEASLNRAEQIAQESESSVNEVVEQVERWLQATESIGKKLAKEAANPVV